MWRYTLCAAPRSEVREQAIKQIRTTDPADEEGNAWKVRVERSVLALEQKMKRLSAGWGGGLLGMGGSLCLFGLGFFVSALNSEACAGVDALHNREPGHTWNRIFVLGSMPICFALLLALDLATTSSRCDFLMVELNAARIKHGSEHDGQITWLTTSLEKLVSEPLHSAPIAASSSKAWTD